jgi:3-hydroxyacyl-CoA dehydrogenase
MPESAGRAVRPARQGRPKNGIVLRAIENLKKLSPAPLGDKDHAAYIEVANYEDNLEELKDAT